ncbi:MAG: hypothetical protein M1817_000789 [Caeruleum heppii]|nr:MAG: hypothetical protein M1817_000789 [Caeruleum heppii]
MGVSHVLTLSILLTCSLFTLTRAVFADEAFVTDYHLPLLGIPQPHTTFFHRPHANSKAALLYTLSEKKLVGAVNPKDGSIVWRHRLADNVTAIDSFLRAGQGENSVISAVGNELKAFDALDGKLVWANQFSDGLVRDLEVIEIAEGEERKGPKDVLVLLGEEKHGIVRRLNGQTGDVVWEHTDDSGDVPFQVSASAANVYYISLHPSSKKAYKIKVTSLDPLTGKQSGQYNLATDADITSPNDVLFVGANSASPIIVWADKASEVLKVNIIGSKHISSLPIEGGKANIRKMTVHAPHLTNARPHFLVQYQAAKTHWAEVYHIDLAVSTVSKAYSLPKMAGHGVFSTSTQDANVYFTRNTKSEVIIVSSASHGVLARWPVVPTRSGSAINATDEDITLHAVSEVIARSSSNFAVRTALTSSTGDWSLIRNGEPSWVRPEELAGIVAAEWVDLGEEEDLARELETEGHQNVLAAYVHRVRRHAKDLRHMPGWLQSLPLKVFNAFRGNEPGTSQQTGLHQDTFGFRKLIIAATEHGRLYGLDTANQGRIVWSTKVFQALHGEMWDVKGMLIHQRLGFISIRGAHGDYTIVNIKTGQIKDSLPPGSFPLRVEATAMVASDNGTSLLDIYEGGDPGEIPSSQVIKGDPTLVVRAKGDVVRGLRFVKDGDTQKPVTVWQFNPDPGFKISALTTRPRHDPVASIGRVLGDRSVRYKYLNPNLALITTINEGTRAAQLHLLDAVSGEGIHSVTHEGIDPSTPIATAMTENWFVYSYWGEPVNQTAQPSSAKGPHLVVSEVYESDMPNDRGGLGPDTDYSSLDPSSPDRKPASPHVISQAFLIPQRISQMAISETRQGITSRNVLASLPDSDSIVAIPKSILEARRPVDRDPTAAEAEEGLLRYHPVLELHPAWMITHKRQVVGVRKIITCPALLESTSLVFAWGNDVFGTRVAPSMAFDILGKGFNRIQLVLTVLALAVGVAFLGPLVTRRQINARWQVT